MAPFIDPQNYQLTTENLWIWEAAFFLCATLLLAVARHYLTFLKEHTKLVVYESLAWGIDTIIIILGISIWRYMNSNRTTTLSSLLFSSLPLAMMVGIGAGLLSVLLEIGGLNTVIYSEKYPEPECTLSREYCDGQKSRHLLFEIASVWMILFIYVITAYFVFNSPGVFKSFKEHYYPKPFGYEIIQKSIGYLISIVSSLVISVLSLVFLIALTPLYCIFFLCTQKWNLMEFMRNWNCIRSSLFSKVPRWDEWNTGYVIFLWQFELIVFGLIFAAPILYVIKNRLDTETPPIDPATPSTNSSYLYGSEFVLLFAKFVLVIGLKMMIESMLTKPTSQQQKLKSS